MQVSLGCLISPTPGITSIQQCLKSTHKCLINDYFGVYWNSEKMIMIFLFVTWDSFFVFLN